MYQVNFLMQDGSFAVIPQTYDEYTAWKLIAQYMLMPNHPRFGWLRKVGDKPSD